MPRLTITLATRDWDHLTPLLLGDVTSEVIDLRVTRLSTLVPAVRAPDGFDGVETSLSRYVLLRQAGEDRITGLPNFIMRGFRHRCVLVRQDSELRDFRGLKGGRIGLTGWHDTGNIWTRVALKDGGLGIEDATWFVGRLDADDPITDRLRGFGRPGLIDACPQDRPLLELLAEGKLDAICTPFLPPECFGASATLRPLLPDVVGEEQQWFRKNGFVPGHHLITLNRDLVQREPWISREINRLLDQSRLFWQAKRRKYAETSPWMLEELLRASRMLPDEAAASGRAANLPMLTAFCTAMAAQGITPNAPAPETLFDGDIA